MFILFLFCNQDIMTIVKSGVDNLMIRKWRFDGKIRYQNLNHGIGAVFRDLDGRTGKRW